MASEGERASGVAVLGVAEVADAGKEMSMRQWNFAMSFAGRSFLALSLGTAIPAVSQQTDQRTFPSATLAVEALFNAVQNNEEAAIMRILGGPSELTSSGDRSLDQEDRAIFVENYQEMHRLGREPDGSMTLYIGAENWPFPTPLVAKNAIWRFDFEAGMKEVIFRRIGANERMAIVTCHDFVSAARDYRPNAEREGFPASSPDSLVANAARGTADRDPVLMQGYYFRMAPQSPGKFVLIAYPAEYKSSGVKTFVTTNENLVYEKDLGPDTRAAAAQIGAFKDDGSWLPVE